MELVQLAPDAMEIVPAVPGSQPNAPERKRAKPLPLHKLIEALFISRLLRSAENLPEVLMRAIATVYGAKEAQDLRETLAQKTFCVPKPTQLSHARLKLDVLLMQLRREQWHACGGTSGHMWVMLSSDSSPQGLDFMVTVEDRIRNPGLVIDATPKEIAEFSLSTNLQTSVLPPAVIGSGNSDTPAKFEALLRSVMLDVGEEGLTSYGRSVVGFCSDFGVESHLTQAEWF